MSLYYINPEDEYRDCKGCCVGTVQPGTIHSFKCYQCKGTGKLGNPDAKPWIQVWEIESTGKWQADTVLKSEMFVVEDSEAEALEAARAKLRRT